MLYEQSLFEVIMLYPIAPEVKTIETSSKWDKICEDDDNLPCSSAEDDLCTALSQFNSAFLPFNVVVDAAKHGAKIGEGAFGAVYKGILKINKDTDSKTVAIKFLSTPKDCNAIYVKKEVLFQNEVEILSK